MKKFINQNIKIGLLLFAVYFITIGSVRLYGNFNIDVLLSTFFSTGLFALFFTTVIIIYQLIYMRINKVPIGDFDIRPNQSATFTVQKTIEETTGIIEASLPGKLNSGSFKFDKDEGYYKARTKTTFRSWGENIIIKPTSISITETRLSVSSRSILKTTIVDFGKGSMNIYKIKTVFDKSRT